MLLMLQALAAVAVSLGACSAIAVVPWWLVTLYSFVQIFISITCTVWLWFYDSIRPITPTLAAHCTHLL